MGCFEKSGEEERSVLESAARLSSLEVGDDWTGELEPHLPRSRSRCDSPYDGIVSFLLPVSFFFFFLFLLAGSRVRRSFPSDR